MTSARKIEINRMNSRASTGPKSVRGKAHAAKNARRHGLSLSIISDTELSKQVESLAQEIVGETTNHEINERARRIAEAQIDLNRIRQARHYLLAHNIDGLDYKMTELAAQHAQPPQKVVIILSDLTKQLILMDRYEQRALSRRKFAIRAFDLARRKAMTTHNALPPAADGD